MAQEREILDVLGWEVKTRAAKHKELLQRTAQPAPVAEVDTPWYYGHLMAESSDSDSECDDDGGAGSEARGGDPKHVNIQRAARLAAKRRAKQRAKQQQQQPPPPAAAAHIATIDDLAPVRGTAGRLWPCLLLRSLPRLPPPATSLATFLATSPASCHVSGLLPRLPPPCSAESASARRVKYRPATVVSYESCFTQSSNASVLWTGAPAETSQ